MKTKVELKQPDGVTLMIRASDHTQFRPAVGGGRTLGGPASELLQVGEPLSSANPHWDWSLALVEGQLFPKNSACSSSTAMA